MENSRRAADSQLQGEGPLMEPYKNLNGDSPVRAFELGSDSITIEFEGGRVYLYTESSTGLHNVELMKRLAETGVGLGGFISKYVRRRYARQLR